MANYSDIKGFTVQTLSSDPVASKAAGGSWASGADLNTARSYIVGVGISTAALAAGGYTGSYTGKTESYNGTAWTETTDLNTTRAIGAGAGTYTAAIYFGGAIDPTTYDNTESWNGSSWTEVNDLNEVKTAMMSGGTSTAAICAGGSPNRVSTEIWDGTNWTEVNNIPSVLHATAGGGSTTSAIIATGQTNPPDSGVQSTADSWDGTNWSEISPVNTARYQAGGTGFQPGTSNTDVMIFGGGTPSGTGATEFWDGSTWTEIGDMSTARGQQAGSDGTSSDAIVAGGALNPGAKSAATEEWTASSTFTKQIEGQLFFNSTTNTFKETISDVPGTSWSSGTNLNSTRAFNNAAGSIPSAITFGGSPAPTQAYAEQWNGSAWTEVADLNEGRVGGAGGGASGTDAIMAGGYELPNVGNSVNTEIWDGSSWTEVNNLNAQKYTAGSAIPVSTSGFAFGGNPSVATAEVWDGTNWTEVSDLNTARMYLAGFGSATSAIAGNGIDPSASPPTYLQNKVEKWDGSSWTEVAEYNTARVEMLQGQGSSNTAGIVAGGGTTGSNQIANTEIWNGTSWTEANDLATARRMGGQIGSTTNGMYVGGNSGPGSSTTVEHWESGLANKTITAS